MSPICSTYINFYAPWLFGFLFVNFSDSYSPKMIGCEGVGWFVGFLMILFGEMLASQHGFELVSSISLK